MKRRKHRRKEMLTITPINIRVIEHEPDRRENVRPKIFFDNSVEEDLESLRDGTGRYSTPKEDAIFTGSLIIVFLALIGLCWYFASHI